MTEKNSQVLASYIPASKFASVKHNCHIFGTKLPHLWGKNGHIFGTILPHRCNTIYWLDMMKADKKLIFPP